MPEPSTAIWYHVRQCSNWLHLFSFSYSSSSSIPALTRLFRSNMASIAFSSSFFPIAPLLKPSSNVSFQSPSSSPSTPRRAHSHILRPSFPTPHTTITISINQTSSENVQGSSSTTPDSTTPSPPPPRPNLIKYKSQRSILSSDKRDVNPHDVNQLMIEAGKEARDLEKWEKALKASHTVVSARLVSGGKLVGFARATSDHALNGTIWDVVTDPALPDETLMKRNVMKYLLKELRRTVPGCSIALFSNEEDRSLFESLDFVADPDGIRGMALFDPTQAHFL